jgi:hypothetical protein
MNKTKKTIIVCVSIYIIVGLIVLAVNNTDRGFSFAAGSLILSLIYLVVGALMCSSKKTVEIGKGLLICAGVLFLIGFSVCSANLSSI